jgi:single-strand DNA-binding protein
MSIYIASNTLVATTPRHIVTQDGMPITSFRVAEPTERQNVTNNWFTVTVFGDMAIWAAANVSKGERWDVHGELYIRDWDNGETTGTSAEIEAALLRKTDSPEDNHECNCPNHKGKEKLERKR